MLTSSIDYQLPPAQIAQRPMEERDGARMLIVARDGLRDGKVAEWSDLVPAGSLVVLNDTQVLRARLMGHTSDTGGKVELLLLRRLDASDDEEHWSAMGRPLKALRPGRRIRVGDDELRVVRTLPDDAVVLAVETCTAWDLFERSGHVPLPPYVRRADEPEDRDRYQTVFAQTPGSVAAPTAGLHLTPLALARLRERGVETCRVTLHVGAGTFRPVKTQTLDAHPMHSEEVHFTQELVDAVNAARRDSRTIVAVGTTVVRALESAAGAHTELQAGRMETNLFIKPGFDFQVVNGLLTNFHAPRSTLLALVCAFAGHRRVMEGYDHAVRGGYRFLSYGDAMWIPERPG